METEIFAFLKFDLFVLIFHYFVKIVFIVALGAVTFGTLSMIRFLFAGKPFEKEWMLLGVLLCVCVNFTVSELAHYFKGLVKIHREPVQIIDNSLRERLKRNSKEK